MKSLQEQVADMRDMILLLRDQADALEELAHFFGGGAPRPARPTAAPSVELPPLPLRAHAPEAQESHQEEPRQEGPHKSPRKGIVARKLRPEEKQAIRDDWEKFPPHLRTAENRRALAAKYNCPGVQIFALLRGKEHFRNMALALEEKKADRRARFSQAR